jgi:hypothetical protein
LPWRVRDRALEACLERHFDPARDRAVSVSSSSTPARPLPVTNSRSLEDDGDHDPSTTLKLLLATQMRAVDIHLAHRVCRGAAGATPSRETNNLLTSLQARWLRLHSPATRTRWAVTWRSFRGVSAEIGRLRREVTGPRRSGARSRPGASDDEDIENAPPAAPQPSRRSSVVVECGEKEVSTPVFHRWSAAEVAIASAPLANTLLHARATAAWRRKLL